MEDGANATPVCWECRVPLSPHPIITNSRRERVCRGCEEDDARRTQLIEPYEIN